MAGPAKPVAQVGAIQINILTGKNLRFGDRAASGHKISPSLCESSVKRSTRRPSGGRGQCLSQWRHSLEQLANGASEEEILTSMYDQANANYIFWWVTHVVGDDLHSERRLRAA